MPNTSYAPVQSVFTRVGDIAAATNDYTFAQLASRPTTLAGYGITDAINIALRGAVNGVASLDAGGLILLAQLPISTLIYKGTWNATTNTPTLSTSQAGAASGWMYVVGTAGTQSIGEGSIAYTVNQIIIYDGTNWKRAGSVAAPQVNSDWSSSSGASQILNLPTTFTALGVQIATAKLLGRTTSGTGVPETITLGSGLSFSGNTLVATGSGGSVTTASVVAANGFAGSVANPTTTPAITISTSITGLLKGNGTAISAATAGTDYVTPTGTTTLTNKRVTKRAGTETTNSTTTVNTDNYDIWSITALASANTINVSGTPTDGQTLIIRIRDNGVSARGLTWNAIFRASPDLALPTTTILSKLLYVGFIYNGTDSKFDLLAYLNNFA